MKIMLTLILSAAFIAPAALASRVEVLDIDIAPDGDDVYFTADPNGLYTIWSSCDLTDWNYAATATELEPGLYVAHHGRVVGLCGNMNYTVVAPGQPNWQNGNPQQLAAEVLSQIDHIDDLPQAQRDALIGKARDVANANSAVAAATADLSTKSTALANCLREVARLREIWKQLDHEASAAEAAERDADAAMEWESEKISDLTDALATAEAEASRAFEDWRTLADIAAAWRAEDGFDSHCVLEARRNADIHLAKHEAALLAVADAEAAVEAASGPLEAARAAAEAATTVAHEARGAANDAHTAYDEAKALCDETKATADTARSLLDDKQTEQAAAIGDYNRAQREARAAAAAEREARLAREAQLAAEARAAAEQAEAARQRRLEETAARRQAELNCFFDFIRRHSNEETALDVARNGFGALLEGAEFANTLLPAIEAAALGRSVLSSVQTITANVLTAGYGLLVDYAGSRAKEAVAKLGFDRTTSVIGQSERPAVGEMRCIIAKNDRGEETGEVYLAIGTPGNATTVFSWSKGNLGVGKGFNVKVEK